MNLHVIYIPLVLLIGLATGYVWGMRAGKRAAEDAYRRARE